MKNPTTVQRKSERELVVTRLFDAITTVTFEEQGDQTMLVLHELYPSQEALDRVLAGMECGMPEQFGQLDELLVAVDGSMQRS